MSNRRRAWICAVAAVALHGATGAVRAGAQTLGDAQSLAPGRIVNGTLTGAYPTTGALLLGASPATATLNCSGVMIGCSTFLTAAHCVCPGTGEDCQPPNDPDPSQGLVFLQHAGFFPIDEITVHPDFDHPLADLAIVKLGVPVEGIPPARINLSTPDIPSPGTIVGFGRTGGGGTNADYGLKRFGAITTTTCLSGLDEETICWSFFGEDSNTCGGDSGGPLFMDLGTGEVVAGVTSGGASFTCLPDDHSFDVNVANYSAWITAAAGADLNNTSCGTGSQLGDPDVIVIENPGILLGAGDSVTYDFPLSSGSDQLRIAFNGHDSEASDFNLLVRRGAPPTDTLFDCKQDGTGQYGFCQFNNPAGGIWYARVEQIEGSGQFQVTATNFGADPSVCGNSIAEPGEQCDGVDDAACAGLCQAGCTCPPPMCGNDVEEFGEACDGTADSGCVTECDADCACACMDDRLTFERLVIDHRRILIKAAIDAFGGELADRDPRLGFAAWFSDGGNETNLTIPPGDPGWIKSRPERRRFRWKGDIGGVRSVNLKDDASLPGTVTIKMKGKAVDGSANFDDDKPISAEIGIEGVCAASLCGDTLINATTGEECDDGVLTVTCDLDCTAPFCGDAFFNPLTGELCDDGVESAACDLDCTLPVCGDATLNEAAGEQCDDANAINTDVCPASCLQAVCGDGYLCTNPACTSGPTGSAELCDQGAANSNTIPNRCRTNCRPPSCGDDVTDSGEACDDSGESPVCDDDCSAVMCGDANPNQSAGEACDTGGESATCDPNCTLVACGDGYINASANEQCDDMDANFNDACPTTCRNAFCGDGFLCTFPDCTSGPTGGAEQCDQGAANSNTIPDRCRTNCTAPSCGDLVTDVGHGENCDQGGIESATCDPNCTSVICGDGYANASAGEACDDSNASNNDMCLATSCAVATCGDGFLCNHASCTTGPTGGSEQCDNGAANSDTLPNRCRTNCADAHCGDGVDDSGEQCDDGGESAACDANCTNATCGDGTLNLTAGEECDQGAANSNTIPNRCRTNCELPSCGDDVTDAGEQCDDGGESATCDANCTNATCGDGTLNLTAGEACDNGAANSDTTPNACRTSCELPSCGDDVTDAGEQCDDGGESAACDANCTNATCGDGTLNLTAGEACDNGAANSDTTPNACRTSCELPSCGDDVTDAGEQCDDGGESAACDANCTNATCGDGTLNLAAGEACDNGAANSDTTPNACRTSCELPSCGDDVTDAGEQCDDGGESAACDANCTNATCGDGTLNLTAGEACDNGAANSDTTPDACRTSCDLASCGDGVTDSGEQCDDSGESATCDGNCTDAECGDGTLNLTAGEQCDDGDTDPGDGCDGACQIE